MLARTYLTSVLVGISTLTLAGCPLNSEVAGTSDVSAAITISSTRGEPPFNIVVSGESSTSINGAIAEYRWDFDDGASAIGMTATHTFTEPGFYRVTLVAVDQAGRQGIDTIDVRVAGGAADATIAALPLTGKAPLLVFFDGTSSTAEDDTIRDYYWDFGDGETSRRSAPSHTFTQAGDYEVALRVVSGGGVEAESTVTISVLPGETNYALEFADAQSATLPFAVGSGLDAFVLEFFVKPAQGGTAVSFAGTSVSVAVSPEDGMIRVNGLGDPIEAAATIPANQWSFVALAYDASEVYAEVFLAGEPIVAVDVEPASAVGGSALLLGSTFEGRISEVRLFGVLRTRPQIQADATAMFDGTESGLLGLWPLDDGAGQFLRNLVPGAATGELGTSDQTDDADPTWVEDAP